MKFSILLPVKNPKCNRKGDTKHKSLYYIKRCMVVPLYRIFHIFVIPGSFWSMFVRLVLLFLWRCKTKMSTSRVPLQCKVTYEKEVHDFCLKQRKTIVLVFNAYIVTCVTKAVYLFNRPRVTITVTMSVYSALALHIVLRSKHAS